MTTTHDHDPQSGYFIGLLIALAVLAWILKNQHHV
jgi:hypothetical protein